MAPTKNLPAAVLAMHKKWNDAALQLGGAGAKVVVYPEEAKPLIYDLLKDIFRPMNISVIYRELKAAVPSPVLKRSLDEMIKQECNGDESDDNGISLHTNNKKSTNKFHGSVCAKLGKSANGTLYYLKQENLDNKGSGLGSDQRNTLVANSQKSAQEMTTLMRHLKCLTSDTSRLLSEPTHKNLLLNVTKEEEHVSGLKDALKESRKLLVNEKQRKRTRKCIQSMADIWWKRRRMCIDFLQTIEDATEGTISLKKCLSGSGHIEVESDESVVNEATKAYRSQKSAHLVSCKQKRPMSYSIKPTANLVGMKMDRRGYLSRVYAENM